MSSNRRESLHTLPNEILFEVVFHAGEQSHLLKRYRVPHVLSKVNHRLRQFALPLILCHLKIPECGQSAFAEVTSHLLSRSYTPFIRKLCLGRIQWDSADDYLLPAKELPNLQELREFICYDWSCDHKVISALGPSTQLTSLSMNWQGSESFPDVPAFTSLSTLRLSVLPPRSCKTAAASKCKRSWPSLKTLSITDLNQWLKFTLPCNSFPNLQVLRLRVDNLSALHVFQFVSDHQSLSEISLSFTKQRPLFGALVKLMMGVKFNGDCIKQDPCAVPQEEIQSEEDEWRLIPLTAFSFVRLPFALARCVWKHGKPPEYDITSLALCAAPPLKDDIWQRFWTGSQEVPFGVFPDLPILRGVQLGLSCKELCMASPYWNSEMWESFVEFADMMYFLSGAIHNWPNLAKFTFSLDLPPRFEWAPLYIEGVRVQHAYPYHFLDYVNVPCNGLGQPLTMEDVVASNLFEEPDMVCLREEIKAVLRMPGASDSELNLLVAWQLLHEPKVAASMRAIAVANPALEVIEWYTGGPSMLGGGPLWKWKVHRSRDGRVRLVTGDLSWTGCTKGDPEPLRFLCGSELEWERATRQPANAADCLALLRG